jgi:hypothetical protein
MLVQLQPTMQQYILRISIEEICGHLLGTLIQNAVTSMMAFQENAIVDKVKLGKYFSIILDAVSALSHQEQMSLVLR